MHQHYRNPNRTTNPPTPPFISLPVLHGKKKPIGQRPITFPTPFPSAQPVTRRARNVNPWLKNFLSIKTPKIPAENQKFQPKFTAKTKKSPFKPQKPTKPRFSPINFPSKTVIFLNFPQKSRKSSQKVKKSVIFKTRFCQIHPKSHQKPPIHPKKPPAPPSPKRQRRDYSLLYIPTKLILHL